MSVRVSSDLLRADMPVGGVAGSENYSGASAAGSPAVDSNNLNDHDDESGELDARRPRSPLPDDDRVSGALAIDELVFGVTVDSESGSNDDASESGPGGESGSDSESASTANKRKRREWVELGSCAPVNVSKELDGLFNAGYTRGLGYSVESGNVQEYKCCFHGRLGCEYSARVRTHTDALNSESMCTIEEFNEHHHDYSKQTTKTGYGLSCEYVAAIARMGLISQQK